jgi:AAA+ ATPase superfamily predicted ATPase
MNKNWIDPKIVIGSVATGREFFKRDDIVEEIWDELKKGNSVLIAAPRRVGKTSIMQYMEKQPTENYQLVFQNIQGIDSANEFFERVYTSLLSCLNTMTKATEWINKCLKSKSIKKIGLDGVEFEDKPTDFLAATNILLKEINDNPNIENIILLLDELPEVLFKINKTNNKDAISILKNLRHWRQQPEMNKKVKFVLAGSIGIHYIVDIIENRNSDLNDLAIINLKPLSDIQAHEYINWTTQHATITYNPEQKQHLLSKIQYYVPYFINLLIDEINKQAKRDNNSEITLQDIDSTFDTVVKNNDYFKDWKKRLQDYMPKEDFDFVNEMLIHTAHKGNITLQDIYDKAVKYNKTADYMDFVEELEKDGYITNIDTQYRFISPFLSAFWKKNNPIYNF